MALLNPLSRYMSGRGQVMTTMTEIFSTGAATAPIEVFVPDGKLARRAVLVLHGSAGLGREYHADIASFAEALVAKQIAAAIPHYFAPNPPRPNEVPIASIAMHYAAWKGTCTDALTFMGADPRFDPARLAVVGFSLGGHFALSLGLANRRGVALRCIVDFFGPTLAPPLQGRFDLMPPVQIHHGSSDTTVYPRESEALVAELKKAGKREGKDFVFERYPGQTHRFDSAALAAARAATVEFIDSRL
jgi:dienelactone hydrolase